MAAAATISPTDPPAFLQALDHVMPCACCDGWLSQCPVWGCNNWLHIQPVDGHWHLECPVELEVPVHTHDDVCAYLGLDDVRVDRRPGVRAWLALRLARTPDAWAGLILGLPVQPEAIDQLELARQRKARLWL